MSKPPAFMFYSSDFLTGTMFFSHEQVGKYIRLLCYQHQHEKIEERHFDKMVGDDPDLRAKFTKNGVGYYNERLKEYMDTISKNAQKSAENGKKGGRPTKKPKITSQVNSGSNQVIKTKPKHNLSEYEYESVYEYVINSKKYSEKFTEKWKEWCGYLLDVHDINLDSVHRGPAMFKELRQIAKDEAEAVSLIDKAILKGWKNLYANERPKKDFYTYQEVLGIHSDPKDPRKQQDFECDQETKKWTLKKPSS